jgi:hypothetical protein
MAFLFPGIGITVFSFNTNAILMIMVHYHTGNHFSMFGGRPLIQVHSVCFMPQIPAFTLARIPTNASREDGAESCACD